MHLSVDVGEAATEARLDGGQARPALALAGSEPLPERGLGRFGDGGWHRAIFADPAQWRPVACRPVGAQTSKGPRRRDRARWQEVAAAGAARFRSCSGRRSAGGSRRWYASQPPSSGRSPGPGSFCWPQRGGPTPGSPASWRSRRTPPPSGVNATSSRAWKGWLTASGQAGREGSRRRSWLRSRRSPASCPPPVASRSAGGALPSCARRSSPAGWSMTCRPRRWAAGWPRMPSGRGATTPGSSLVTRRWGQGHPSAGSV
jgi:hypothetical protein